MPCDKQEKNSTRGSRLAERITICSSAVVILALVVLAVVYRRHITVENIVSFTPGDLWLAALVFMALYAVKSLTAVVYVKLLYAAAGLVFPLPLALAVNVAGTVVQMMIPFLLGRVGGRSTAAAIVRRHPRLGRISALRRRSSFWFCAFVRAVGLFPFDPVSLYFGACGMPLRDFILGSLAGTLPILVITTVVGTSVTDPGSRDFIVSAVLFVLVQAAAAVGFLIWIRKNNAALAASEEEMISGESAQ